MKRYAAAIASASLLATAPAHAQLLEKLEQSLLGGQGQGQQQVLGQGQQQNFMPGTSSPSAVIGNVNLPPGQYMLSNVQTGQAFYVVIQNGQMSLTGPPGGQQFAGNQQGYFQQPQQSGVGGMIRSGLGSFLKNQLVPQQAPGQ